MERFSKEIQVGSKSQRFEFTQINNVGGVKFFITSIDANNKPISFSVKQNLDREWKLFPGSQRWLYEIEDEISKAIVETRLQ